jgi:hypothetical protein
MSAGTERRIRDIKGDAGTYGREIYDWEPKLPKLPNVTLPLVNMPGATQGQDTFANLAAWWQNETVPELRRYTLTAFVPAPLQQPIASLMDRLPASVCALPPVAIAELPLTFKYQVCPVDNVLQQMEGGSPGAHSSWAYTLAEVAMGAAGYNSTAASKGRVEAWLMRMCR